MHIVNWTRAIRAALAAGAAAGVILGSGGVASAAPPASQACVGKSLSALATSQPSPGAFGAAVVGFAQAPDARPGLGDGIQALQAGVVPDEVVPNTCND
ncbi:MAG: hypothetical protein ABW135_09120 [Thermoleophilaceae bacterium]